MHVDQSLEHMTNTGAVRHHHSTNYVEAPVYKTGDGDNDNDVAQAYATVLRLKPRGKTLDTHETIQIHPHSHAFHMPSTVPMRPSSTVTKSKQLGDGHIQSRI